jgi:hypothetical protein
MELVNDVLQAGLTQAAAAGLHRVSVPTVRKWVSRLRAQAELQRREQRLTTIRAARERLEARQAQEDAARGRTPGDERQPQHPDGSPKRGERYKRAFGQPEDKAQENFTDPDSRIMKRAGGGFDQCHNAQAGLDAEQQIIVGAELTNCAADNDQLVPMLDAVERNLGVAPEQALADAGYRGEEVFEQLHSRSTRCLVALGREAREQLRIDPRNRS